MVDERSPERHDDVAPPDEPEGSAADFSPPDEPTGSFEDAATEAGQRRGDTMEERLAREEPDRRERPDGSSGRLAEEDRPDDVGELVGELADDVEGLSEEESAVEVRPDAPGGTEDASDDYVPPERR